MEYKSPASVFDYTIDWTDELGGDTIVTSVWAVDAGLTEDSESEATSSTTIFVSGGVAGETYQLVNTITSASRTYEQRIAIKVQDQII